MLHKLKKLDSSTLLVFQKIRNKVLTPFFTLMTRLGDFGTVWILIALFLLGNVKTRKVGLMVITALIISGLINNLILKNTVARKRPYEAITGLKILIKQPTDFSFPSGHTASSIAVACVIFRNMPRGAGIPALILAVLIATSRMYLGVHYPSDILMGAFSGFSISYMAQYLINSIIK